MGERYESAIESPKETTVTGLLVLSAAAQKEAIVPVFFVEKSLAFASPTVSVATAKLTSSDVGRAMSRFISAKIMLCNRQTDDQKGGRKIADSSQEKLASLAAFVYSPCQQRL